MGRNEWPQMIEHTTVQLILDKYVDRGGTDHTDTDCEMQESELKVLLSTKHRNRIWIHIEVRRTQLSFSIANRPHTTIASPWPYHPEFRLKSQFNALPPQYKSVGMMHRMMKSERWNRDHKAIRRKRADDGRYGFLFHNPPYFSYNLLRPSETSSYGSQLLDNIESFQPAKPTIFIHFIARGRLLSCCQDLNLLTVFFTQKAHNAVSLSPTPRVGLIFEELHDSYLPSWHDSSRLPMYSPHD